VFLCSPLRLANHNLLFNIRNETAKSKPLNYQEGSDLNIEKKRVLQAPKRAQISADSELEMRQKETVMVYLCH
jgi:hypothetical protein